MVNNSQNTQGHQRIHLTVFSQAYYVDSVWGFGCPSGGIRNFGDLCHKHGIPVTWMISPKSARCESEMLTHYHEKFGDDVGLFFRYPTEGAFHHKSERDVAQKMSIEDFRKHLREQRNKIKEALPWAAVKVAGQGIRTIEFLNAAAAEGFTGMFGHCYCQIGVDSITDFGMPWGSFLMRPGSAHLPARKGDMKNPPGVVAFEWTQRDLNKSLHTARPEVWSTDPNDVERGGICTDTNVEYWKEMFMQYERALPLNPHGLWFQFHQEAHEQTWGEICRPFTEERVIFCTKMMDLFFDWLKGRPSVEFITAGKAAELYLQFSNGETIPTYCPSALVPVPKDLDFWNQVKLKKGYCGNIHKNAQLPDERLFDYLSDVNNADPVKAMESPPWKDSFFYFDGECQLVFDIGKAEPVVLFNYMNYEPSAEMIDEMGQEEGGGAIGYFIEPQPPKVAIDLSMSSTIQLTVENNSQKTLPTGLFLWETVYPGIIQRFTSIQAPPRLPSGVIAKKSLSQGVFLRFKASPGISTLAISFK